MPRFQFFFEPDSVDDILTSYRWGLETWGEVAAEKWLRELYRCIYDRLTVFPRSCPVAPESRELDREVRQLVFLRYRIVFEIDDHMVIVLRVDGPFTGLTLEE